MSEHANGLWFGLSDAEYHDDPALGSGSIKDLSVDALHYWRKARHLNETREDDDSEAKDFGKATHVRLLEGADKFRSIYAAWPSEADHPAALKGGAAMKDVCRQLGLKVSGTNAELAARIRAERPETQLWDDIVAAHAHANAGKTLMNPATLDRIERTAAVVESHAQAASLLGGNGHSEVSCFWEEEDLESGMVVRMKARFDRLKVRAIGDLKTFNNKRQRPVDSAIADQMASYSYHVQAVHYDIGLETFRQDYKRGDAKVYGNVSEEFISALVKEGQHAFVFLFLESCDYPAVRVRKFDHLGPDGHPTLYWSVGDRTRTAAIRTYVECMKHFGPDRPWITEVPMTSFQDTDFPLWMSA